MRKYIFMWILFFGIIISACSSDLSSDSIPTIHVLKKVTWSTNTMCKYTIALYYRKSNGSYQYREDVIIYDIPNKYQLGDTLYLVTKKVLYEKQEMPTPQK